MSHLSQGPDKYGAQVRRIVSRSLENLKGEGSAPHIIRVKLLKTGKGFHHFSATRLCHTAHLAHPDGKGGRHLNDKPT